MRSLVGVEVVVQDTVDEVGDQSQEQPHGQHAVVWVCEGPLQFEPEVTRHKQQGDHKQPAQQALFRQRPEVLAVGVPDVSIVGADECTQVGLLERGVLELVRPGPPPKHRTLLEHGQGARPTVESLQIGVVTGHIGNALHVLGQVI